MDRSSEVADAAIQRLQDGMVDIIRPTDASILAVRLELIKAYLAGAADASRKETPSNGE